MPANRSELTATALLVRCLAATLMLAPAANAAAQDAGDRDRAVALYDEIREGGTDALPAALDRAATRGSLSLDLLLVLGSMLHWTSQGPAAVAVLERATATEPGSARAWKDLGDARAMTADAEAALAAYRRAAETAPSDPALDAEARERLARSARRHALLVERAGLYAAAAGAYRQPSGETWILRYDPYLALFPTLLVVGTGEYRVLRPTDDPRTLDYATDDGPGSVELVSGAEPHLRWTPPGGTEQSASLVPIDVRSVTVDRPGGPLSGTLLVPAAAGSRAGIALLHGGGLLSRYHVMNEAWVFAAHGLAAVVWDKRGTGRSTGVDWTRVGFDALVEDASAMVERLRAEAEVDPERVGLWGHSQGGWHAPLLAARDPRIAFAILASGPATSVHRQFIDGMAARMRAESREGAHIAAAVGYMERLFAEIRAGASVGDLGPLIAEAGAAPWSDAVMKPELAFEPRWWRENDFDPESTLRALRTPVLAIFGARDDVVPVATNAPAMTSFLAEAPVDDFTVQVIPGADHSLAMADDRVSPIYLRAMVDWLAARGFTE